MSNNLDLSLALLGDDNSIAQVVRATVYLDAIVQEFLKSGEIENLVANGLLGINSELFGDLLTFFGGSAFL